MARNSVRLTICVPKDLHDKYMVLKPSGFKLSRFVQDMLRENIIELEAKVVETERGAADANNTRFDPFDLGFIQGVFSDLYGHWSDTKRAEYLRKRFNMTDNSVEYCIGYFKWAAQHGVID